MSETKELLRRGVGDFEPAPDSFERVLARRDRKRRNQRIRAGVLGIAIAIAVGWWGIHAIRSAPPVPADEPTPSPAPSADLGIFAPVAGRIVYETGSDLGYGPGYWAVDPNGPSDTVPGPRVADDAASTLVPLDLQGAEPLGWSSDGTELLLRRSVGDPLLPETYLSILHADGSETRLNEEPMGVWDAAISPDGTRVVFAGQYDLSGLYVLDAEGDQPVPLPIPQAEEGASSPTFSPDGTQIAYLAGKRKVGVANADGTGAYQILAPRGTVFTGDESPPQWSPAGDRLAIGVSTPDGSGRPAIYTFAPDGSRFTQVITGGIAPYWSPDGSQIAYTIPCDEHPESGSCPEGSIRRSEFDPQPGDPPAGLAIADADGSNVREFGFAASGPWHPGVAASPAASTPSVATPTDVPSTVDAAGTAMRHDGEVLHFEPSARDPERGDLVAVHPGTGDVRVLVEDLDVVGGTNWSADGRWIAYDTWSGSWVVGSDLQPRLISGNSDSRPLWAWSFTGAQLAMIEDGTLYVVDPSTGQRTELRSIEGDVTSHPVWSPDGTRIVFGARGGAIYSVDARTGERSLLMRLPGDDLDSVDGIAWSPDGSRIAIFNDVQPGEGRLFVVRSDGSGVRILAEDVSVLGLDWSPDGSRIAFADSKGGDLQIWVTPADGSAATLLASYPDRDGDSPVWSPDGSKIAFSTGREGALVINSDGSGGAEPMDALTYESWRGGGFGCEYWTCFGLGR